MPERETWATRIGFILAAVGSAVGLGNIWRFPYLTAESGGAAFLVVYLVAVVVIGFPAMLAEFSLGRESHRNVVDTFDRLGRPGWKVVGALFLLTGFWLLSYYSVIGGWVLQYMLGSVTGGYLTGDPGTFFSSISQGWGAVAFHAVFMLLTVGIVAGGIERGIELATKVMVPAIVLLMLGLAVWAATIPGAGAGYDFYLTPNFDTLVSNAGSIIPDAVGQALFTLSLGMGVMITYSSYLGEDENLVIDGLSVVILNTLVGILAGFVVFPLLFAQNVDPGDPGPGAIFVGMASAFQELPLGWLLGLVFFSVVAIAALSSAISLLEVVVSYAVDNFDVSRPALAGGLGVGVFLLGIPSALSTDTLSTFDTVASNLLLPLGAFFVIVFVGWVAGKRAVEEIRQGTGGLTTFGPAWLWHTRTLLLVAVAGTLLLSFLTLLESFGVSLL